MAFRILSLSGGGIRGIFQAHYLAGIAQQLGNDGPLHKHFELIAGTSTGSIVGLGIALGLEPDRIVRLFDTWGPQIFPARARKSARLKTTWLGSGARYRVEPLRQALTEAFGDKMLGDALQTAEGCRVALLIPASALDTYDTRTFSTIHNVADRGLPVVPVIMASSAAPLFFPAVGLEKFGDRRTYVDGGLWANNPSFVAVMQAHRHYHQDYASHGHTHRQVPFRQMRVISVGNGEVPGGETRTRFNKMWRARMIEPVLDLMFAMQSRSSDAGAAILVNGDEDEPRLAGEENFLRINVTLPVPIALDDVDAAREILPGLAQQAAARTFSSFKRMLRLGSR